jgi:hypothetical protein
MANPNRTVARWRNSNPTFYVAAQVTAANAFEAEIIADEIRFAGYFAKVKADSYKIGPRTQNSRVHVVRCYKKV